MGLTENPSPLWPCQSSRELAPRRLDPPGANKPLVISAESLFDTGERIFKSSNF
jgi:hypothetical protein